MSDRDSFYLSLWSHFGVFSAGLTEEQRTELDGLLWDLASRVHENKPVHGDVNTPPAKTGAEWARELFGSYFIVDEKSVADLVDKAVTESRR